MVTIIIKAITIKRTIYGEIIIDRNKKRNNNTYIYLQKSLGLAWDKSL